MDLLGLARAATTRVRVGACLLEDMGQDDRRSRLVEIRFEDGIWMLATTADLEPRDA